MATKPVYENEPIVGTLVLAAGGSITAAGTTIAGAGGITIGAGQALTLGGNTNVNGGQLLSTFQTLAAASTDSQAVGSHVTGSIVSVTSAASGPYAITLPVSVPGMSIEIMNISAYTIHVYPNAAGTTTETINALSANAQYAMVTAVSTTFNCTVAGQWWTNPRVPT